MPQCDSTEDPVAFCDPPVRALLVVDWRRDPASTSRERGGADFTGSALHPTLDVPFVAPLAEIIVSDPRDQVSPGDET